jgi:hypothetical protein
MAYFVFTLPFYFFVIFPTIEKSARPTKRDAPICSWKTSVSVFFLKGAPTGHGWATGGAQPACGGLPQGSYVLSGKDEDVDLLLLKAESLARGRWCYLTELDEGRGRR